MRKTLSFFSLFATLAITASAQQPKVTDKQAATSRPAAIANETTLDTKATAATNDLDKSLSLTKEQREKVFQINRRLLEREARLKAAGKTPEQCQQEIAATRIEMLLPLLNEEQRHKLKTGQVN